MNIEIINKEARRLERVMKYVSIDSNNCWKWKGAINQSGYGFFNYGKINSKQKMQRAHRYMYEIFKGEIPKGLHIDHLCRVRDCCNPDHLEAVTPLVNVRRGLASDTTRRRCANTPIEEKRRWIRFAIDGSTKAKLEKTHCRNGHEFTPENTKYRLKAGRSRPYRKCLICKRQNFKKWKQARRKREADLLSRIV